MSKQFWLIGLVSLSLLTACSKEEDTVGGSPEQVAETMVDSFATADPAIKQAAAVAAEALKNNEYEKAYVSINALTVNPTPTVEQQAAITASIETLYQQLGRGVSSGDPNAMRVLQMIRDARR